LSTTTVQAILGIAGLIIVWLSGLVVLSFRIGKFETRVSLKLEENEKGRQENRAAIESTKSGLEREIKEMRREFEAQFRDLFREVVRNPRQRREAE